jgi:hypothetical protein
VSRRSGGESAIEVRLAAESETPTFGWARILDDGNGTPVRVSLTAEHSSGGEVSHITRSAVFRHPVSGKTVRYAERYSLNHKYTLDVAESHSVAFYFVNLSDNPVRVGHCQTDSHECLVSSLPETVLPLEQKMFLLDPTQAFFELDSTPGYSAGMGLRLEQVSSSIKFQTADGAAPELDGSGASPTASPDDREHTADAVASRACPRCEIGKIRENSEASKSSAAARAALATSGHLSTPEELAHVVEAGQGSKCVVITIPPGAEVTVDGNVAGVTPLSFVLLRHGDVPRVLTIKLPGYKTVERRVIAALCTGM